MPRIQGSTFFNGCYVYVDYSIGTVEYLNNRTRINWTLGVHNGTADIRYDNAQAAFTATGGTSGDANPGPVSTGWPTPAGQDQDQNLESGWFWANHNSSGACTVGVTGSVSSDFGSSSINTSFGLTAIPQTPAAPDSASASRVNDGQINVTWDNNSTGTAPYANVKVYRSTDGGGWALRATLGVVESYSDTSVSANHKYRYRMSAVGQNGVEVGYATTGHVWTTPGAPGTPTASKLGSGNIRLDWSNNVNYSEYTTRIEHSEDGGAFSELTSVSGGISTFEHASPNPAVTHRYRLRARTSSGTTLNSAYSANSNTITLLATANPPTNLAPSGVARDAAEDIILSWTHNPADGTPQSARRIQAKVNGGAYADIVNSAATGSSHTIAGGTWNNGDTITWRVATAGQNGTLSAFSAEASFTLSARPTVNLTDPGGPVSESTLTAEWTYFQAQSSPQAIWQASLYDTSDNLVESRSGTTETAVTFAATVADAATYTVRITVTSAAGLASTEDDQSYSISYLPPAGVTVEASYDAGSGSMVLALTGAVDEPGVTEPIVTVDLQRRINDGEWVTFASGLVLDPVTRTAIVLDTKPTIAGSNVYRAVSYSDLPSSATSVEEIAVTSEREWSFLSRGDGFADIARLRAKPTFSSEAFRSSALHHFAGRAKPVQLTGEATDLVLSVSAMLTGESSTVEEFEAMATAGGVVLWREPTGRRVFGSLARVQTQRDNHRRASITFTVTEIDYDE